MTNQAVVELDVDVRSELDREIVRELLFHNGAGRLPTLLEFSNVLRWNYYHVGETPAFVNSHNAYRDYWFDLDDPTYRGRA